MSMSITSPLRSSPIAAGGCLGTDVADAGSRRAAAEPAVGDQGHGLGQCRIALDVAGGASISCMPGPPLGPS
jgi:hypothetical protein